MASVNERVHKHRKALRLSGMRQIQMWVPDTRRPEFTAECCRQCKVISDSDHANSAIDALMEEAIDDIAGWVE